MLIMEILFWKLCFLWCFIFFIKYVQLYPKVIVIYFIGTTASPMSANYNNDFKELRDINETLLA